MGLHGVCRRLLPSFSAIEHPEIEGGSAAGQSQREYSGILVMFGSTASLAVKGSLNGAVQMMRLVHVLWPSRHNGLIRRNKKSYRCLTKTGGGWCIIQQTECISEHHSQDCIVLFALTWVGVSIVHTQLLIL